MASINGYVPETQVITSAAQRAGDPDAAQIGYPRYRDFLASGLRNLCFEAQWDRRYHDTNIPENRIIDDLPKYISGFNSVWLYNPTSGQQFSFGNSVRAHLKPNYNHDCAGPFQDNQWFNFPDGTQNSVGVMEPLNLYYFGFREGRLALSPQCAQFSRVRIDYTGVGIDKYCPQEPMQVPIWAVDALETYIAMRAAEHMVGIEGKTQEAMFRFKTFREEYKDPRGAWSNAIMYWAGCDSQDRKDCVTAISYLGYRN